MPSIPSIITGLTKQLKSILAKEHLQSLDVMTFSSNAINYQKDKV
jgi:hypothetical protein